MLHINFTLSNKNIYLLIFHSGAKELIDKISKVILSGVAKLIGTASTEPYDVQNAAYNVVAQLARVCPNIVNQDLQLVAAYFDHLTVAPTELHTSLREALISIAPALSWDFGKDKAICGAQKFMPNANQNLLLAMLAQHVESKMQIVQNVASVFLTTCFPEHYVPARYLLLLLAGEKSSLCEAVLAYLYGVSKKDHINYSYISSIDQSADSTTGAGSENETNTLSMEQRRVVLPSFKDMVNYVYEQMEKRSKDSSLKHSYGQVVLCYTYESYTEILEYLRLCLCYSCGSHSSPDDPKKAHYLAEYINQNYVDVETNEICKYLELVKKILYAKRGRVELSCLYDLLNASPDVLAKKCVDLIENIGLGLKDVSDNTRVLVAQSQGILLANGTNEKEFNEQIKEIMVTLPQKSLEHRHGCILTVAHAFQRKIRHLKGQKDFSAVKIQQWSELKQAVVLLGKKF